MKSVRLAGPMRTECGQIDILGLADVNQRDVVFFRDLSCALLKPGRASQDTMVCVGVPGFGNKRFDLIDRDWPCVVLAFHNGEVLVQTLLEADCYIKLAAVNQFVSADLGALVRSLVDGRDQTLEMLPLLGIRHHDMRYSIEPRFTVGATR